MHTRSLYISIASVCFALFFVVSANGQSCQAVSCPIDNNCNFSVSGPSCTPARGSDPTCIYFNPDPCIYATDSGCPSDAFVSGGCCYRVSSPIIIDLESEGFHLTSPEAGIQFRVFAHDSRKIQVAWTEAGSHNGWLVLDRNNNGLIDDFSELFGDQTPQPPPPPGERRNGFRALAVYDLPENGGNGDGWISKHDAIFDKLRVWVDLNHDGISQPNELFSLTEVGIAAISLDYKLSQLTDANGNMFRYRSSVRDLAGSETNKIIYDVLLQLGSSYSDSTATADWFARPQSGGCSDKSGPQMKDLRNRIEGELSSPPRPDSDRR